MSSASAISVLEPTTTDRALYIVYSGRARLLEERPDTEPATLAVLTRGETFGEHTLQRVSRAYSVRAASDLVVLRLDEPQVRRLACRVSRLPRRARRPRPVRRGARLPVSARHLQEPEAAGPAPARDRAAARHAVPQRGALHRGRRGRYGVRRSRGEAATDEERRRARTSGRDRESGRAGRRDGTALRPVASGHRGGGDTGRRPAAAEEDPRRDRARPTIGVPRCSKSPTACCSCRLSPPGVAAARPRG